MTPLDTIREHVYGEMVTSEFVLNRPSRSLPGGFVRLGASWT